MKSTALEEISLKKIKNLKLNPFEDEDGIMGIREILQNSNLSHSEAHPIILPSQSHFTNLSIIKAHQQVVHSRVAETLSKKVCGI